MPARARGAGVRRGHSHQRGSKGGVEPVSAFAGAGRVAIRRAAAEVGLKLVRMG